MGIEQDKIDLTCALRSAAEMGLHEGVCNHFSYAVDQETFLINPQGVHWLELVPSDMVTVDAKGNRIAGNRAVEPTAFFIHSRIHRAKPSARCIMHAHMPYATALTLLEDGKLEWCSQNAVRFFGRTAYDTVYNGLALDDAVDMMRGPPGTKISLTLKQADKQISGSCKVDADHTPSVEGSVNEKQVTWKYDQEYEGTVYTLTFTGTLDSDTSMKGTVTADPSDSSGDFTAKKQ